MAKYIVAQTKTGVGCLVMERRLIGDVEVYVELVSAQTAKEAEMVANALNVVDVED